MILAMTLNAKSSISGPMTSVREMSGLSGKAATAMAEGKGKFLASVVKFKATVFSLSSFSLSPMNRINRKLTAKEMTRGIII